MSEHGKDTVSNPERWRAWAERAALGGAAIAGAWAYWRERQRNKELRASNDRMRYDEVVPNCYTPAGIQERLQFDAELRSELEGGNTGLIMLDVRALKYLNDIGGRPKGNRLLADTGGRLRDATSDSFRSHPHAVAQDRRHPGAAQEDILCRLGGGGDEFVVIVRDVSPEDLLQITERTTQRFGVERAVQDCQQGIMPIVASVAGVHASESGADGNALQGFDALCSEVDKRHLPLKSEQYEEMWSAVQQADPTVPRPADDRNVIRVFWQMCCPGFEDLAR